MVDKWGDDVLALSIEEGVDALYAALLLLIRIVVPLEVSGVLTISSTLYLLSGSSGDGCCDCRDGLFLVLSCVGLWRDRVVDNFNLLLLLLSSA